MGAPTRAALAAALLVVLAGCGSEETKVPTGFTDLGTVDGVAVYGDLVDDGHSVHLKLNGPDGLGCDGLAALDTAQVAEVCNSQTEDSYTYAATVPRDTTMPKLCDMRSGQPATGTRLDGAKGWQVDVVVAVGRDATWVRACPPTPADLPTPATG